MKIVRPENDEFGSTLTQTWIGLGIFFPIFFMDMEELWVNQLIYKKRWRPIQEFG